MVGQDFYWILKLFKSTKTYIEFSSVFSFFHYIIKLPIYDQRFFSFFVQESNAGTVNSWYILETNKRPVL
jgi:hypothetical protein